MLRRALALSLLALAACVAPAEKKEAAPPMSPKVPPIVQAGAPVLRQRARELAPEELGTAELHDLVQTMIATMRAAPGVGLAAPQIGVGKRVIVLEDREDLIKSLSEAERRERSREPFAPRVFVNPILRPVGEGRAMFFEGCLSVKGYVGLVDRSDEVEVTGLDERGAPQTWRVRGWPARILQHEVDHLEGTLYVDRMVTRSFATPDQAKARWGGKAIADIKRDLGL